MLEGLRSAAAIAAPLGFAKRNIVRAVFAAGAALTGAIVQPSAGLAQCTQSFNFDVGQAVIGARNFFPTAKPILAITTTMNTAFITNTTSFVSAPANPQPNQSSGGVWARTIAGYADTQAKSIGVPDPVVSI